MTTYSKNNGLRILMGGLFLCASIAANAWWSGGHGGNGYHGGGYYHGGNYGYYHGGYNGGWASPVVVAPVVYAPACRHVRVCSPNRCWIRRVCN